MCRWNYASPFSGLPAVEFLTAFSMVKQDGGWEGLGMRLDPCKHRQFVFKVLVWVSFYLVPGIVEPHAGQNSHNIYCIYMY